MGIGNLLGTIRHQQARRSEGMRREAKEAQTKRRVAEVEQLLEASTSKPSATQPPGQNQSLPTPAAPPEPAKAQFTMVDQLRNLLMLRALDVGSANARDTDPPKPPDRPAG